MLEIATHLDTSLGLFLTFERWTLYYGSPLNYSPWSVEREKNVKVFTTLKHSYQSFNKVTTGWLKYSWPLENFFFWGKQYVYLANLKPANLYYYGTSSLKAKPKIRSFVALPLFRSPFINGRPLNVFFHRFSIFLKESLTFLYELEGL